MRDRTLVVILCIMLIVPVASAVSSIEIKANIRIPIKEPPKPGHMRGDEYELQAEYQDIININSPEIDSVTYDGGVANLIETLDEDLYLSYLEGLVEYGPRVTGTEECDDAGEYILNEFLKMGLDARKHEYIGSLSGFNVEATIQGTDESSDEIYIICAHYDTVSESPGADDDGSGVAAVLSAAKIMSSHSFEHDIRFVAFSGEEQGLVGSYYYVDEAVKNNDSIVATLNADMISYTEYEDDGKYVVIYEDEESKWLSDYTVNISDEYYSYIGLEVLPGYYSSRSDHYRFWEVGYNAIFYGEYGGNSYYHSPEDIIENMNMTYAVKISRLMLATLADLTGLNENLAPLKPSRPDGPSSGTTRAEYNYTTSTTDPESEQIYYLFDWDDGADSGWIGPYNSGETVEASYAWSRIGTYQVKVKAKDIRGLESEWSDPLDISMPRVKQINKYGLFKTLIIRILEQFQLLKI